MLQGDIRGSLAAALHRPAALFAQRKPVLVLIIANSAFIPQRSLEDTGGQKTYDLVCVTAAEGDDGVVIA